MMKFLLMLLPIASFPLWAADAVVEPPYAQWVQGGSAVVVCGLLIFILTRIMPAKDKAHEEAEDRHLKAFQDTLDKVCERNDRSEVAHRESLDRVTEALNQLAMTCTKNQTRLVNARDQE